MRLPAIRFIRHESRVLAIVVGLTAATGAFGAAQGQSWTKLCNTIKVVPEGAAEGTQPQEVNRCITLQEQFNNKNGLLVFSAAVRKQDREGETLSALMPLGMDLRKPVAAKIDNGGSVKLDYVSCNRIGCTAEVQLTPDMIKAMKSGKQLSIETHGPRGRPIRFALGLGGFASAYDGNPTDTKQYQQARQQLINQIRARRAEQVQRALQELDRQQAQQQKPAPQRQPASPQQ
jgi:invasion protein IalB